MSDTKEEEFLKMIRNNRRDFQTRLVYADWLDENSRAEEAARQRVLAQPNSDQHRLNWALVCGNEHRADLVRVQLELDQIAYWRFPSYAGEWGSPEDKAAQQMLFLEQQESDLLDSVRPSLESEIPHSSGRTLTWSFRLERSYRSREHLCLGVRKGFIHSVSCPGEVWTELTMPSQGWDVDSWTFLRPCFGHAMMDVHPIQMVRLESLPPVTRLFDWDNRRIKYSLNGTNVTYFASDRQLYGAASPEYFERLITVKMMRLAFPGVEFELP